MRRACVLLLTWFAVLGVVEEKAAAKTHPLRPSTHVGTTYSFGLRALHGDATDVVSGRVMVGTSRRRTLSRTTLRKAIRRGTLTVRVRRVKGRRVRLMVRVDDRHPSSPPRLAAAGGAGAATLSWGPARDDVGVTAYRIARDGTTVATLPGSTRSWSDSGLQVGRTYRYTARAVDRVGKRSRPATTTVTVTAAAVVQPPGGAAAPSPSGQAIPAGDLPGWQLTFSDDFTTNVPLGRFPSAVSSRWQTYDEGAADTSGIGSHSPSRVLSVHDGVLDWFLHSEGGRPLVAAALPRMAAQRYGRYAVRFRSDPLLDYKAAWLLWPNSGVWPRDGEIDFPEGGFAGTFCAFAHHQGATTGSDQDAFCNLATFADWHTAIIEWTAGEVRFILDGQVVGVSTDRVPNTAMNWVLQSETAGAPAPSPALQGHVTIDWVAAWRPA
jgi:hypothetical protein